MKYCIIIPDGMADYPVARLGNRTPLEAARTPNMDRAARNGLLGITHTTSKRMAPGSDVAIMNVLGYDPRRYYTGRAPLEAADMGIEMSPDHWAFRCNLVTISDGIMADFCAGHITTKEAELLINALNAQLGSDEVTFHTGTSYRHILLYSGSEQFKLTTAPPHDIIGQPINKYLPHGKGSEFLIQLMERSAPVLAGHDVNAVRVDLGQNPANMIWLWGQGKQAPLEPFQDRFGLPGAAISAVNLVRGMARLIGWEVIQVPGATGYVDTDYAAKGRYAIDALTRFDIVLVHIEAPDEASHEGDLQAKTKAIERIDSSIVGPIMAEAASTASLRILIMPDHMTPVSKRTHVVGPVPFVIWGAGVSARSARPFTEAAAAQTGIEIARGYRLMEKFVTEKML